jgi:CheY-like chemotaxis protein
MASLPPILIVDDDPDDIFILRRLLAKAGVSNKIVAFEDARAACAHLEGVLRESDHALYRPCVVFTDLQMPGLNGFEFARWIRQHPGFASVFIVMVTSSEDPADGGNALAAGVDKLMPKYPPVGTLRAIVQAALPPAVA